MLCAGFVLLACGLAPANPRDAAVGGFSWKADAATVRFASLLSSFRNCFLPLTLQFVFFLVENSIKCVMKQMALLESPIEKGEHGQKDGTEQVVKNHPSPTCLRNGHSPLHLNIVFILFHSHLTMEE